MLAGCWRRLAPYEFFTFQYFCPLVVWPAAEHVHATLTPRCPSTWQRGQCAIDTGGRWLPWQLGRGPAGSQRRAARRG